MVPAPFKPLLYPLIFKAIDIAKPNMKGQGSTVHPLWSYGQGVDV